MVLRAQGHKLGEAKVFDLSARVDGVRTFVALRYHDRGIEATVKVKGGLLRDPEEVHEMLFEALRRTQLELAGVLAEGEEPAAGTGTDGKPVGRTPPEDSEG